MCIRSSLAEARLTPGEARNGLDRVLAFSQVSCELQSMATDKAYIEITENLQKK